MDKRWMFLDDRCCYAFISGLQQFMELAKQHCGPGKDIRCPCRLCRNVTYHPFNVVKNHIQKKGMDATYTVWRFHGEKDDQFTEDESYDSGVHYENNDENSDQLNDDQIEEILEDLEKGGIHEEDLQLDDNDGDLGRFDKLQKDSKRKLYSNCKRYSVLLFIVKFLHLKLRNRWSNKSFNEALELFKDALPDDNLLPESYYASKKLLTEIGLGCVQIHSCPNDCILFRNQYKLLDYCPQCSYPRYKMMDGKSTKIPNKILRYFPLTPRIQRRFLSRKTALHMRWHKEKRVEEVGYMSHPADGEASKNFDLKFSDFAADSRNVRLALSNDGFNPFNNMANPYSMWPVVVVNYNMPPWEARLRSNLMLSLLIPGPRSPGKAIDVYLQPLIEEL